ncbi:hypothetical protein SDC9_201439 [bioreactor metagenome]|uniref:Uncharacterized protein n=1 Tax=bioreactor metagenome TaxID=1076179 RepID=A0A645J2U0_9ZZZZ
MLDAAALLHGLRPQGVAFGFQSGDVGGLHHRAHAVAAETTIRRQEDIGVDRLALLLQAQAAVQLPGLAQQVG